MSKVVHRVNAPGVAGPVMRGVPDPIQRRIAHVEIRRSHVDLRPQDVRAVGKLAATHAGKEIEIFGDRPIAIRTVAARFGRCTSMGPNLISVETVYIREAFPDQLDRKLIEPLEVIGSIQLRGPTEPEPADIVLDGRDVFDVLFRRVRVIEAEVAGAAVLFSDAEVQADGFRVTDMQVPVRFGREARANTAMVFPRSHIVGDDATDEVHRRRCRRGKMLVPHVRGLF